jgi:signal transduction histidine kinase
MQDLFLYDVIAQLIGVFLMKFHLPMFPYDVIVVAITLAKCFRLLWIDRNSHLDIPVGWPVFGIIGYLDRQKKRATTIAKLPSSMARYALGYTCLATAVLLSYWMKKNDWQSLHMLFGIIPIIIISLFSKKFLQDLEQTALAKIEADKMAAIAQATRAINAELLAKNAELQAANRQRDLMLADLTIRNEYLRDASHDLAAPLFWITSCAQQLAVASNEETRKALSLQLLDAVGHYNQMLQTTIQSAKLITKIDQPNFKAISVNKLADYLWNKYLAIFEKKGLRFGIYKANQFVIVDEHDVRPDVAPERAALKFHIATDEYIFIRIIDNLIMNALRNTAHGRIRVAFRKRRNGVCWVEVRDSGNGFEGVDGPDWDANFDEIAHRIKIGKMKARETASHGLGINNIKNLCSSINTTMMLHSRPRHGSIFRFIVPLARNDMMFAEKIDDLEEYDLP